MCFPLITIVLIKSEVNIVTFSFLDLSPKSANENNCQQFTLSLYWRLIMYSQARWLYRVFSVGSKILQLHMNVAFHWHDRCSLHKQAADALLMRRKSILTVLRDKQCKYNNSMLVPLRIITEFACMQLSVESALLFSLSYVYKHLSGRHSQVFCKSIKYIIQHLYTRTVL